METELRDTEIMMNYHRISFFDCNCMVGKKANRRIGEPWSLEQLHEDMEYFRIDAALVSHALSKDYDPVAGNEELLRILKGSSCLFPVWCILPPSTGEIGELSNFVGRLISGGVRAVIAYPRLHNYSLSSWSMQKLLLQLEVSRIPLLLPFQQFEWDEIHNLCREFPNLPVITTRINYRQLRYLLPLWETCQNLYADLSWFSVPDLLPFLKKHGYLGRLLFGTNYPAYTPAAAIGMVTYSDISDEDKELVAGGTLRNLLSNIKKD